MGRHFNRAIVSLVASVPVVLPCARTPLSHILFFFARLSSHACFRSFAYVTLTSVTLTSVTLTFALLLTSRLLPSRLLPSRLLPSRLLSLFCLRHACFRSFVSARSLVRSLV